MKDYNERLQFYLGTNKNTSHLRMNEFSIDDLTYQVNNHDIQYDESLKKLLTKNKYENRRFSFLRGDIITENTNII